MSLAHVYLVRCNGEDCETVAFTTEESADKARASVQAAGWTHEIALPSGASHCTGRRGLRAFDYCEACTKARAATPRGEA